MPKMRRFKDETMRNVYNFLRNKRPHPSTFEALKMQGSACSRYVVGYEQPDQPLRLAPRNSVAYAAWAAGVDNRRDEDKFFAKNKKG